MRDFQVNGPALVKVQFGQHLRLHPWLISGQVELGLTDERISVEPHFFHLNVKVDDYGPETPANVISDLAEWHVRMRLIHFDLAILDACVSESLGGAIFSPDVLNPGTNFGMAGGGTPLGNGYPILSSGNHLMAMSLTSPVLKAPWTFVTSYLYDRPYKWSVGAEKTQVDLHWRVIPYAPLYSGYTGTGAFNEIQSSGNPMVMFVNQLVPGIIDGVPF